MLPPDSSEEQSLLLWRERVVFAYALVALAFGLLVYIPGTAMMIREGHPYGAALNTAVYAAVLAIFLIGRRIPYVVRAVLLTILFWAVGAGVSLVVGPFSGGQSWLFAFAVSAGLFLGLRGAVAALVLNTVTVSVIGWLAVDGQLEWAGQWTDVGLKWLASMVNLILLNAVAAIGVAILTRGMEAALQNRRTAARRLEMERAQLIESHQRLEKEAEERQSAASALRFSEERYRRLFEDSVLGIFRCAPDGSLVAVNPAFARMFGHQSPEDFLLTVDSRSGEHYAYPFFRAGIFNHILETGKPARLENVFVRKDGTNFIGNLHAWAVGSGGYEGSYIEGFIEDITDRKQAQDALLASEERLKLALEASNDGMWDYNPQTGQAYFSPRWFTMLGFEPDELPHNDGTWNDLLHPEDRPWVLQTVQRHMERDSGQFEIEFRMRGKSGAWRWIMARGKTVAWDENGQAVRMVGIHTDITDRKTAERETIMLQNRLRQSQKMEAIGTLAGGVAHDFNNLLSAINGYAELSLSELPADHEVRPMVEQVLKAGVRARDLVKQILTFSRQSEPQFSPVRISTVVKETLKFLRSSLPRTIDIKSEIMTHDCTVMADPTQIQQVLMNLCTNSAQAMMEKGGLLTVCLKDVTLSPGELTRHLEIEPGHYLEAMVSDTGKGMEASTLERIFEPYFTTKKSGEGTGLGLAVVHGIVKTHGGGIEVASSPGIGTTFKIFLPLIPELKETSREDLSPVPTGTERVLLVDDEKSLTKVGKGILGRLGYRVETSNDSRQALEEFRSRPDDFDLVITDQTMPGMTGMDLAGEIMRIKPGTPVILCTGYSATTTPEMARAAGIKAFVMKPFDSRQLATIVRKTLDGADEA